MDNKKSIVTKLAFLSVSFMVTSAYAIQGSLPQLKAALHTWLRHHLLPL